MVEVLKRGSHRHFKVAQNYFQHIPRLRFWCVIITTFNQLMLQSWNRKTNCPITGEHVGIIFVTQ